MSAVEPIDSAFDILKAQTTLDQWGMKPKPVPRRDNKIFEKLERFRRYDEVPNSVKMHLLPKNHDHYPHEFANEMDELKTFAPWGFNEQGRPAESPALNLFDDEAHPITSQGDGLSFSVTQDHIDAQSNEKAKEWAERLHRLRGNEERISYRSPTSKQRKEWFGEDGLLLTPQEKWYLRDQPVSRTLPEQDAHLEDLANRREQSLRAYNAGQITHDEMVSNSWKFNPDNNWNKLENLGFSENRKLPTHYAMPFSPILNPETSRDTILPEHDWSLDRTTGWEGVEPVSALRYMRPEHATDAQKRGIKGREMHEDAQMWEHEHDPRRGDYGKRMPFDVGPQVQIGDSTYHDEENPYLGNFMAPAPLIDDGGLRDSSKEKTDRVKPVGFGGSGSEDSQWVGVRGDPSKMTGQFANTGHSAEGAEAYIEGDFPPEQLVTGGVPRNWIPGFYGNKREWGHLPNAFIQGLMPDGAADNIMGWEQRDGMYTFYDKNRNHVLGPISRDDMAERLPGGFQ